VSKTGAPTRVTVLKPLGLMSTPNPYGQYPAGSLSDATNVAMRRPGELSNVPAGNNYTPYAAAVNGDVIYHLAPVDQSHIFGVVKSASNTWKIYESQPGGTVNTCTLPSATMSTTAAFVDSRVGSTRSRSRLLINSARGVMVGDSMTPSSSGDRTFRWSGLPQPTAQIINLVPTAGAAIPTTTMVAYSMVITREFADGYIVKGVPSVPYKFLNSDVSNTIEVGIRISFGFQAGVAAGDFIEVYRTDGLETTVLSTDPGSTFKLIGKVALTSTDISNGNIIYTDKTIMSAPYFTTSGRELYTNPYQEGSTQENRQPDVCRSIATFKGFTFYGNLTERAQYQFSVPGGMFDIPNVTADNYARLNGIGRRQGLGTWSIGGTVISGISATHMQGLVVGQLVAAPLVTGPAQSTISAVGASSITVTPGVFISAGAAANFIVYDQLEVNGVTNLAYLAYSFPAFFDLSVPGLEVHANQAVGVSFPPSSAAQIDTGYVFTYEAIRPVGVTPGDSSGTSQLRLRATNGANYSPPLPDITAAVKTIDPVTTPNLVRWSKDSEPEHVPDVNDTQVGSGQIISMVGTKDALWIACSDGIYRLSGDGGVWRVDIVSPGVVLCGPRCMVNLRDQVFAYTDYGFGAVTDSGFVPISHNLLRDIFPGVPFSENSAMCMGIYGAEMEVYIHRTLTDYLWVYNANTSAFTRVLDASTHLTNFTAMALLENPTSGSQVPVFALAESAVDPAIITWDSTTASPAMAATYWPFYSPDPATNKQWMDMTYMFHQQAVGYSLLPATGGLSYASTVPLVAAQGGIDASCTVGISRRDGIAPKIIPGFAISGISSNAVLFYGISVRYVLLTIQQGVKQ
jgi:hypothetical protein